jgi:hypothetical protein
VTGVLGSSNRKVGKGVQIGEPPSFESGNNDLIFPIPPLSQEPDLLRILDVRVAHTIHAIPLNLRSFEGLVGFVAL